MKKDSVYAFVAGILLTMLLVFVAFKLLFPDDIYPYLVSAYVFTIVLWLYAYRVSRKKAANPSI